jgi:hypothetical protein
MSMMTLRGAPRSRRGEAIELRLILALTYPVFLLAACAGRLAPRRGEAPRPSVFREARLAADRTIHLAFMG